MEKNVQKWFLRNILFRNSRRKKYTRIKQRGRAGFHKCSTRLWDLSYPQAIFGRFSPLYDSPSRQICFEIKIYPDLAYNYQLVRFQLHCIKTWAYVIYKSYFWDVFTPLWPNLLTNLLQNQYQVPTQILHITI